MEQIRSIVASLIECCQQAARKGTVRAESMDGDEDDLYGDTDPDTEDTAEEGGEAMEEGKGKPKKPVHTSQNTAAAAHSMRGGAGAGKHHNKQDYERGHARHSKHKGRDAERE